MSNNRKLKNFFIYPEFQWKLIFLIMGAALISPLLLLIFQLNMFREQIHNGQMMNLPETHPYYVFYHQFQEQSLAVFGLSVVASFVACFIYGIIISHRVAGPVVKLKKHFESIAEDSTNDIEVSFRENDYFKEVAYAYNLKFRKKSKSENKMQK